MPGPKKRDRQATGAPDAPKRVRERTPSVGEQQTVRYCRRSPEEMHFFRALLRKSLAGAPAAAAGLS